MSAPPIDRTRLFAVDEQSVTREQSGVRVRDDQPGLDPGAVVPEAPINPRPPIVQQIATQRSDQWMQAPNRGPVVAILRRVPYDEHARQNPGAQLEPGRPTDRTAPDLWEQRFLAG